MEKETIETEYGVVGLVKERKQQYKKIYERSILFGTGLCIMSIIPFFIGLIIDENNAILMMLMLSFMFILAGVGVILFIRSGIVWASYEKLLQEGDYSKASKEKQPLVSAIYTAYWVIAAAIYLGFSFIENNWATSWVVLMIAGVLFPAVIVITNSFANRKI